MTSLPDPSTPLNEEQSKQAFAAILDGAVSDNAIAEFLVRLSERGETAIEIAAAAQALRARMVPIIAPDNAIDVCGTGGDGHHTLNISTAVAIVVAACGVPVAKHGNRAASSKAGAADTLEALGLNLSRASERAEHSLADLGICFLFAQAHHPSLAHIAPIRRSIGQRTIFNLMGPLANPAKVMRQLIGIARPDYVPLYAEALLKIGTNHSMVVSGDEGLDELSLAGRNNVTEIESGELRSYIVNAADAGLPTHSIDAIKGGDADHNARELRKLLQGEKGPYRDAVLFNSAAALMVADQAKNLADGVEEAAEAIDKGLANALLNCWITF